MTASRCVECPVRPSSLCGSLSDVELTSLNRVGRRRQVKRGETLAWVGDKSLHCSHVVSGVLKLSTSTSDGREQIVDLLFPGDLMGRPYAEEVGFTVTALSEADLCMFPRHAFEQVIEGHAAMERMLLQRTLGALDDARMRMLTLGRKAAGEKVAAFLLGMAARMPASDEDCSGAITFKLPLTRGEIAEMLGLTIETVSRQMASLKLQGLIGFEGARSVSIHDVEALSAVAEKHSIKASS